MYCIYKITNILNGNTYIGQHKYTDESNPMKGYKGSGLLLWKAYKKYGFENFETEILYSRIRDKCTVDSMEIWAIAKYKPEYNISKGGTGGVVWVGDNPMKGRKHSEESRRKMSLSSHHDSHRHEFNVYYWNAYTRMYLDIYRHHSVSFYRHHSASFYKPKFRTQPFDVYVNEWLKIYKQHSAKRIKSEVARKLGEIKTTLGKHWYNNGVINVMKYECPEGFVPGYIVSDKQKALKSSESYKAKLSESAKLRWEMRKLE